MKIEEGTWFGVPLRTAGYGLGLLARRAKRGAVLLAYFFPGTWTAPPTLGAARGLRPDDAIRVARVGVLGLSDGTWPILGRTAGWRREDWPVPRFLRIERLTGRNWIVEYSDADVSKVISETAAPADVELEEDGMLGAGAAEIVLTRLLESRPMRN